MGADRGADGRDHQVDAGAHGRLLPGARGAREGLREPAHGEHAERVRAAERAGNAGQRGQVTCPHFSTSALDQVHPRPGIRSGGVPGELIFLLFFETPRLRLNNNY